MAWRIKKGSAGLGRVNQPPSAKQGYERLPLRVWLILATVTIARIGSGMQTQSVGAVGPSLVDAMGLAYVALGTLIGAYSLPGIAVALPGSWLIARMGDRRMVLTSLALMGIGGGLMAMAQNYPILLAGRVLSGTGAAMLSVAGPKIVFDQVPPERLTSLLGGVLAGYPLGFAFSLSFLPLLNSWRLAMGLCQSKAAANQSVTKLPVLAFPILPQTSWR
jgi:predicted MFS family arabinose efflux permease